MGFLDKLKSLLKPEERSYEDIMQERSKIKNGIVSTLKDAGFTTLEIKEVIVIIEESERKIESLKNEIDSLCKYFDDPTSNIQDLTARVKEIKEEIASETKSIDPKLKDKVQEILDRKQTKS